MSTEVSADLYKELLVYTTQTAGGQIRIILGSTDITEAVSEEEIEIIKEEETPGTSFFWEFHLSATGTLQPKFEGTLDQPPEPETVEDIAVFLSSGVEISKHLTETDLDDISCLLHTEQRCSDSSQRRSEYEDV